MTAAQFERCTRLFGVDAMERLAQARVAVFGLGGVGSFCVEALARTGVGNLRVIDHDRVSESNTNRQLMATSETIGQVKVEAMAARVREIAPTVNLDPRHAFFAEETAEELLAGELDGVVDAIDSLGPKVELIHQCQQRRLHIVSALGAGARIDPTRVRVAPLARTRGDPLGVQVRKQLRRRGSLDGVMAAFSEERPRRSAEGFETMTTDLHRGRQRLIQPSAVMVPATMGMAIAAYLVSWLAGSEDCWGAGLRP